MDYKDFIRQKQVSINSRGFLVDESDLNGYMKDFQRFSVKVALHKGSFALFEDCGLGKTLQQLEWARMVSIKTGKPVIGFAPFAVTGQTIQEGQKFGIEVNNAGNGNIQITNYEQLENIDPELYGGVFLDESSILKNHEGAYRNLLNNKFRNTHFKLCCSATPSPNDPMELGNHSEFLGWMNRNEMLATYFIHDGGETAKWRIKGHAEDTFYNWVCDWALMYSKPSDIGFSDDGYVLPELRFIEKQIITENRDNGLLYNDVAVSATNFHKEVKITRLSRIEEVVKIANSNDDNFIIWIEQNDDGPILRKNIKDAIEVKGSDKDTFKLKHLLGFANNEFRVLITKTKIASFGMNYQNCHNQIFASPDHSYEKIYQGVRRSLRFGQEHDVNIYLVTTDTMENVLTSFRRKQMQHEKMLAMMNKHTLSKYGKYAYSRVA